MREPDVEKFLKLLKLPNSATLADLKMRYAELSSRFDKQISSGDEKKIKQGRNNRRMLQQAFTTLSGALPAVASEASRADVQEEVSSSGLSVELFSARVGFQVLESGLFSVETRQVQSNLFGMRSSRSNASLKASWPAGKLTLYNDHLVVSCLLGSESISLKQIEVIEKVWYLPGSVVVRRKPPLEEMRVVIAGWGIAGKIKNIIQQNRLRIRLAY